MQKIWRKEHHPNPPSSASHRKNGENEKKKSICARAAQSPFARSCNISGKIKLASSSQWIYSSLLQSKGGLFHILSPPLGTSFPPKLPTIFSNEIIPTRKSVSGHSTNFLMQNYMQHSQTISDSM